MNAVLVAQILLLSVPLASTALAQTAPPAPPVPAPVAASEDALRKEVDDLKAKLAETKNAAAEATKSAEAARMQLENAKSEAKENAARGLLGAVNSQKVIDLAFGVLPNSDKKANNFASVTANYSPALSTKVVFYSRNLNAQATKNEVVAATPSLNMDTFSEVSMTNDQTKISLDLLEYRPVGWSKSLTPVFTLGVDQLRDQRQRRLKIQQTFADPKTSKSRVIISSSTIDERTIATLPRLQAELSGKIGAFTVSGQGGIYVGASENVDFREQGLMALPPLSRDANRPDDEIKASVASSDIRKTYSYKSNGFKAGGEVSWDGEGHGFGFAYSIFQKKGERKNFDVSVVDAPQVIDKATGAILNEGERERVAVESRLTDARTTTSMALSWTMRYAKSLGVIPIIRVGLETDRLKTSGEGRSANTEETKQYDFGVVFSY